MNILYLTNHLNTGGITSYVYTLATGMKKRGHNIYVASSGGQKLPEFTLAGINFIPIPVKTKKEISPKIILSWLKLSSQIKNYQIDIVHSHSRTTQVLGALLSRRARLVHISTCHGFFKRRLLRQIFPCWGRKVIAISQQVKEHLIQDFKVKEERIAVIHNGIDVEWFTGGSIQPIADNSQYLINLRRKFALKEGPVVGNIARLSDVKGQIYLIEAMKSVCDQFPNAQLVIAGEGRMRGELRKRIEELGLGDRVSLITEVLDTRELLSIMDVFVMPSLKEGLGLALMEAMAAGLAVVGSSVGGIKTLIQDGVNGLLVEPANPAALSKAISALLQDPGRRSLLAKKAREFIQQNFSQEQMVSKTEGVYRLCLKEKD